MTHELPRYKQAFPAPISSFIGRKGEVTTLTSLLLREEVRLLTLTGPGGIGKTRLGLHVAAPLSQQFPDGVWFIDLAPLTDAALVLPTIVQAFRFTEASDSPLLEQLIALLCEKRLLLLLDNFEQVLSAATQVAQLLVACPTLKVLVTSRCVLHLQGEQEFVVPPLALPDPAHLSDLGMVAQSEAVTLFLARAQSVRPDFQLTAANAGAVTDICVRLEGIPLFFTGRYVAERA